MQMQSETRSCIRTQSPRNDSSLNENTQKVENDIILFFDQVAQAVEKRKIKLLDMLQELKNKKMIETNCRQTNSDINGDCLRFYDTGEIYNAVEKCGIIDEKKAYSKNTEALGVGLKYAICNEPTFFYLKTCNIDGDLSWVEQDKVCVTIQNAREQNFKSILKNNCDGIYEVFYELNESGKYKITVKVNNSLINNSPFECCVFEKHDLKFSTESKSEQSITIQKNKNKMLLEDSQKVSNYCLSTKIIARAWKVRIILACLKVKVKLGYYNNTPNLPYLNEKYYCIFEIGELYSTNEVRIFSRYSTRYNRKQSSFKRSSLTFLVIEDPSNSLIRVAHEESCTEKITSIKGKSQILIPFISINHFCHQRNCPSPSLVLI
ncbi:uncharacterized protein LOC105846292 isoform X1 [Hydra vulgaris]|uniref:uncharacterized protein LOC105846292 isoform X1 n=1 Tax=Hydra vulgaris TaxID=6087 RepID=UPI000640FA4D|nr:uncharacterized protein LOC105846292 isoform X1 [Hydra vulgaris]